MTGYGGAKSETQGLEISIELKSVNNRYLDTSIRLPRNFIFAEESLKSAIQSHISRGKVDVFVSVNSSGAGGLVVSVNEALAEGYIKAMRDLAAKYGLDGDISVTAVAKFPDVLSVEKEEADKEELISVLSAVLEEALEEFDTMRCREGEKLRDDILSRADEIERLKVQVEERSPQTVSDYRARLESRMKEVLDNTAIEESRILVEAAIFADKVSVDEETVRLSSHLSQLREMVLGESPIGRKLDFLVQEMNREANTIGSKANDTEVSKYVLDLKAEIEKIREQVQNIE